MTRIFLVLFLAVASCGGGDSETAPPGEGPLPEAEVIPEGPRRSVVLVVVDSLRADRLGAYGGERPVAPFLDARAAEGHLFENVWATSSWILPSFGSILTGRTPTRHRAGLFPAPAPDPRPFVALAGELPTLAERFDAAGYATGAIVHGPFFEERFGLLRGFDTTSHGPGGGGGGGGAEARRADEVVDEALDWVGEREAPYFLLVHLYDPHFPYDPPEATRGRFRDPAAGEPIGQQVVIREMAGELEAADEALLRDAYDEEVAFVDEELERLLDVLLAAKSEDGPVVMLTADHGEELFDHGGFGHGHALWEELLRVPLVLWGEGVEPGRTWAPVSLVDVAPTLLEAAGLGSPKELAGISLWGAATGGEAPPDERALVAERLLRGPEQFALRLGDDKLVVDQDGATLLYDLALDPGETYDLARDDAGRTATLSVRLRQVMEDARPPGFGRTVELEPGEREALRAQGYLE